MKKISKSSFLNYIKNRKILLLILCVQLFLIIFYIYGSTENIVYQDALDPVNINLIENLYTHKLSFGDLWKEYNGINIFASLVFTLINIVFFKLNTRFEMLLSIVSLFITSILMFGFFEKLVIGLVDNKIIQILFAPVILIFFSLNQWENFVFNGGSIQIIAILPFILMMIFYDKIIFSEIKTRDLFLYLIIVIFSTLLGGQYTFGLIVSLLIGIVFKKIFDKKNNFIFQRSIFFIVVFIVIYFLFYLSILNKNFNTGGSGILNLFNDAISSLKFIFLTFSGSLVGVDMFNRFKININFGSVIGLVIVLTYLYSFILYFKSKMSRKTIVPLVMIFYSIVTVGIIFVSRFSYGINYGLTSRYTTSTMLGLIGCIIIFLYNLFNKSYFKKIKIISLNNFPIIIIFLFILICQVLTNMNEWMISPYRKVFYKKLEVMALDLDGYSKDDLSLFQAKNVDYIYNTFAVLKKYKLNVFKEGGYLGKQNGVIKLSGWNPDGWIDRGAKIMIVNSKEGVLSLNLYIPADVFNKIYKNSVVLQIINGGDVLGQENFLKGSFDNGSIEVVFDVPKETKLSLDLKLDKYFVPAEYNLGKDSRELGVIINDIKVK